MRSACVYFFNLLKTRTVTDRLAIEGIRHQNHHVSYKGPKKFTKHQLQSRLEKHKWRQELVVFRLRTCLCGLNEHIKTKRLVDTASCQCIMEQTLISAFSIAAPIWKICDRKHLVQTIPSPATVWQTRVSCARQCVCVARLSLFCRGLR